MNEDLDHITEQDLIAELERPDISAEDALIYMKMLCAKKGMTSSEWEEYFREQKRKQSLRQHGVPEDFITKIIASLVRAMLGGLMGKVGDFLSIDDERKELGCSYPTCPEKPYNVMTITREKIGSDNIDAVVVVALCKEHSTRIEGGAEAGKLRHDIVEAATREWTKNRYKGMAG